MGPKPGMKALAVLFICSEIQSVFLVFYRATQQNSDLSLIDFAFGCSTVRPILLELMIDGQSGAEHLGKLSGNS